MTYQEIVEKAKEIYENADAGKVKEHVAIQFNVTGEGAGAFYLEIKDGKVDIQPYEYFDRDVLVTTSADVLLQIVSGKLGLEKAYLTGRLHAQGNLGKALLLKEVVTRAEESTGGKRKLFKKGK